MPQPFPGTIGRTIGESRPGWPPRAGAASNKPNLLVLLFDDVGFADFGCYGSSLRTPAIDALATRGLRLTGFHTTAMCSTTRAALTETGPTGPFDGWPLGRGHDRYYGFMDAETDPYAPELVRDNTPIPCPGSFASGYHLSVGLVDPSLRYLADHAADQPGRPWHLWLAPDACHAPPIQALMTRLQPAYAAMLDPFDQQLARLVAFLDASAQLDDTLIVVLSDNGARQEGRPLGFINAMGPYNQQPESLATKQARIDDIGGPDTHSNFPWGWALAANTPLKRYQQNTHGGGIRDPLVISWPKGLAARGQLRHGFHHATDLAPTLLDLIGAPKPARLKGLDCLPFDGESFAPALHDAAGAPRQRPQYFELFGHRGLWADGWKAVAFQPRGQAFDDDVWELLHLEADFNEIHDQATARPERLQALIGQWWQEAAATLLIDGEPAGSLASPHGFHNFISGSGLDIGLDRGSPVSHDQAPFACTGTLRKVTVTLGPLPGTDGEALAQAEMARQ